MANRSLIVLSDDGAAPLLGIIGAAKKSIRVKMFVFTDPLLIDALVAACHRGVKVRVMLNAARRTGEDDNEPTRKKLLDAHISVIDSSPKFDLTHEKSMVVDDELAVVQTLNWTTKNLTETRDYAVVTNHRHEVEEVAGCFDADWHRQHFDPGDSAHLIWCPLNGRDRIIRFIDQAKDTLFIQNERYQDTMIIEHLVHAARQGIKVHIMAPAPHKLDKAKRVEAIGNLRILDDLKIGIRKLKGLKLHGKVILADGKTAIIGSPNLTPGTFDTRREAAIEVSDDHVVKRLEEVVHYDWKHAHPIDLSDEGLIADLEDPDEERRLGVHLE